VAADELLEDGRCNPSVRAVRVPVPKRKRKVAGRKIAPLICMPAVAPLSDSEWQPYLHRLPSRPELTSLRSKLDSLMTTYLGVLEAEAASPSAREVAMVLERIARLAHEFARYLFTLDYRLGREEAGSFNTASAAAADILAKTSIKPENRSVLDAALRGNEVLAAVAVREAKKLAKSSKKGRPTGGAATGWVLRQLADLLRDNGLVISSPLRSSDPFCVLCKHFLRITLPRAKALRKPEWACKEIETGLMLGEQVFLRRLRQAAQPHEESSLPI
jgi:hypothetical protein